MNLATAFVEARIDDSRIRGDMRKVETDVKSSGDKMGKSLADAGDRAFKSFTQAFGAIAFGAGIKGAIDKASDLNETVSKTEVIFGSAAGGVIKFADTTAKSMGLSKQAYLDAASGLKGLLDNMGLTQAQSTKWSQDLVALGSDLGSFFNKDPAVAIEAIGSALRGETEPIRAFNVQISEAAVKQKALELGLYSGKGAIDAHVKAQATLALIIAQTSAAQGDFARTADGAANSQRIAKAEMANSAASLGQNFLPVYQKIVQLVGLVADGFGALPGPIQLGVVALVGFVALSGPIRSMIGILKDVTTAIGKIPEGAKSAGIALGVLATVVMVGLSLRAQEVAKSNQRMLDSFNELSRVADAKLLDQFVASLGRAMIAGRGTDEALTKLAQTNLDGANRVLVYAAALGDAGKLSEGQIDVMNRLREAVGAEETARAQATKTQETYGATTQGAGDKAKVAATWSERLTAAQDLANASAEAAAAGQKQYQDRLDAQGKAADEAATAQRDLASAINEMIDAALNAADSQLALNKAEDDFAAAATNTLQVQKDKGQGSAEYKAAIDDERDALISAAKAQQKLSDDQAQALGVTVTATQKVDNLNSSLENQAAFATPAAQRAAYQYILQLNQIPEQKASEILALVDEGRLAEANAKMLDASKTRDAAIVADAKTAAAEAALGPDGLTRTRYVNIIPNVGGGLIRVSAEGRFVPGGSNMITSTAEIPGSRGDEVILPLGNPSRLAALLGDNRVGPRVAAAMGGGASFAGGASTTAASSAGGPTGDIWLMIEGHPFRAMLAERDRGLVQAIAAGRRA